MPYIDQKNRDRIHNEWSPREYGILVNSAGELNYVITVILDEYISEYGDNYRVYNEVIGVLECVKQEIYRRVVSPYEDFKRAINGDVFYDRGNLNDKE